MQKTNFVGLVNPTYNVRTKIRDKERVRISESGVLESGATGRLARSKTSRLRRTALFNAFTMAEILLSLTIIGVVAAITLPSLMANINERTWNTQRKALYARMSQAIAMMPSVGGYGTLTEDENGSVTADTAAETFLTEGLSKVLKINNICDNAHLQDCGIPTTYIDLANATKSMPTKLSELHSALTNVNSSWTHCSTTHRDSYQNLDTKAAAFETQNGESVLTFYRPNCLSRLGEKNFAQDIICANMIFDLNGNKGPNIVGKDIGYLTALYSTDSVVVAPMPYSQPVGEFISSEASSACTLNVGEDYRLPTKDEAASLFVNSAFSGLPLSGDNNTWYTSSKTLYGSQIVNWVILSSIGQYRIPLPDADWYSLCIKR